MIIIGVNGHTARDPEKGITHNSGAAWLEDGRIVAAIDEERLSRCKNDKSYPLLSIGVLTQTPARRPDFVAVASFSMAPMAFSFITPRPITNSGRSALLIKAHAASSCAGSHTACTVAR